MKRILLTLICFVIVFNSCLTNTNQKNPISANSSAFAFPDTFIQKGSDADTSYFSLRIINQPDSQIQLECTGWGIEETGLFLLTGRLDSIYYLRFMGYCGTIFIHTWVKPTLTEILSSSLIDSIASIQYLYNNDTILITKHRYYH
jgi:hypothetical protein